MSDNATLVGVVIVAASIVAGVVVYVRVAAWLAQWWPL